MRILVTGGGTGGHITPLVALAGEIRKLEHDPVIVFIGFKDDKKMHQALIADDVFKRTYTISAGKFRRYYGVSWWRQLLDLPTLFKNIRDVFRTVGGTFSAVRILRKERPDVVFAKGGFVGVPVGLAAKITNTPLVTHDSDTLAGLANRISSRWATTIATGAPARYYPYPSRKVVEVGVPLRADVLEASQMKVAAVREELELPKKEPIIIIFGGTHGGKEVNEAVLARLEPLLEQCFVVHVAGASNYHAVSDFFEGKKLPSNYRLLEFVEHTQLMKYFRAADLVIGRAGATGMAEFSLLSVATVIIPNPKLTGGHQLKNAKRFEDAEAAVVIDQDLLVRDPNVLLKTVHELLSDDKKRGRLAKNLNKLAKPNATAELARLVLEANRGEAGE